MVGDVLETQQVLYLPFYLFTRFIQSVLGSFGVDTTENPLEISHVTAHGRSTALGVQINPFDVVKYGFYVFTVERAKRSRRPPN